MRKLVLSGICVLASALAFACSSKSQKAGAFDNGSTGGTAGSGAGGTGSGTGGSGGSTQSAPYPDGPYGFQIGDTLGPDQTLYGWVNPKDASYKGQLQPIKLSDFYDPDGSKGIKVILFDVGAVWCKYCNEEEGDILKNGYYATYKPKGGEIFSVLFQGGDGSKATAQDLSSWTYLYKSDYPSAIDPGYWFLNFFDANAAPLNMFVNARTMKILDEVLGYGQAQQWAEFDSDISKVQ